MIKKELELDNEEVKKAIEHWVNQKLDVKGKTDLDGISLKAKRSSGPRGGIGGGTPVANGAKVEIEVEYERD